MDKDNKPVTLFYPGTVTELARLFIQNEELNVYYGSPSFTNKRNKLDFSGWTASLDEMEECRKISRSERFIEVGSAVTLEELYHKAKALLPEAFLNTSRQNYTLPLRNQITLGSIILSDCPLNRLMHLLDITVEVIEIRKNKKNRLYKSTWFSLHQIEGDIKFIKSLRIPIVSWDKYLIRSIKDGSNKVDIFVLSDLSRGYVSDFRMGFCINGGPTLRNKEWEANIMGRNSFYSDREQENIIQYLIKAGMADSPTLTEPLKRIMRNFLYHFMD